MLLHYKEPSFELLSQLIVDWKPDIPGDVFIIKCDKLYNHNNVEIEIKEAQNDVEETPCDIGWGLPYIKNVLIKFNSERSIGFGITIEYTCDDIYYILNKTIKDLVEKHKEDTNED